MVRYPSVRATISTLSATIASQKSGPKLRTVFKPNLSFSGTGLGIVPKTGIIHVSNRAHTTDHSKKVQTHTRSHRNTRGITSTRRKEFEQDFISFLNASINGELTLKFARPSHQRRMKTHPSLRQSTSFTRNQGRNG